MPSMKNFDSPLVESAARIWGPSGVPPSLKPDNRQQRWRRYLSKLLRLR